MKILLVTATQGESDIPEMIPGMSKNPEGFNYKTLEISSLVTGVGSVATSWGMSKWIYSHEKPDLAINIGIAGSYNKDIPPGRTVLVRSDCFADSGIETAGDFQTLDEAGLADPERFPFTGGRIICENSFFSIAAGLLNEADAITVNTATGTEATRARLQKKFNADIETMEGATFFYICSVEKIPFIALRSVSNFVEPRNREKWDIPLALKNLADRLGDFLIKLD